MKVLILFVSIAHAGWWSDFCNRHLISDDPYQYEVYSEDWLIREADRIRIKANWGTATRRELTMLAQIEGELKRRTP